MLRNTPDNIISLGDNEVFVFGSNLSGRHLGGAAYYAMENFGAEWGVGIGFTGKCYAIPTMHGGIAKIAPFVSLFIKDVKKHPELDFYVTKIGCGIAGFLYKEIAPLFEELKDYPNVALPKEFRDVYENCDT